MGRSAQAFIKVQSVSNPDSMRQIRDVSVKESRNAPFIIKPTSNVCPLAAKLAIDVKTAVESVEGANRTIVTIICSSFVEYIY
ncbi:MAG: hypothetical protein ACE5R6_21100 [Candidatus Heimdallarchaeota archaeon]